MNHKVIIQASANSTGNTNKIVSYIREKIDIDIVDLKTKNIGGYEYDYQNKNDDFLPLMRNLTEHYTSIIFATPVYWYSMSGIMKTFFDRILDCIKIEKEIGLKLKGRRMGLISCGSDINLVNGFNTPFVHTANYLGMQYIGDVHTWLEEGNINETLRHDLNDFIEKI